MARAPQNVAASVHRRLLNRAKATGRPFNELLQHYAMERFLYRLAQSPHSRRFVLKGALLLRVWDAPAVRPTMDIDLLGRMSNEVDALTAAVREICGQVVEPDGLKFDGTTVAGERIAEDAEYEGVRVRFRGALGTARITMQLDVGFGDVITPDAAEVNYPTLLDLPAPRLLAYPRETSVAEKFQAMLHLAQLNSRMKDYYDIWLLARAFRFDAALLAQAIHKTCERRSTAITATPVALSDAFANDPVKQTQWRAFRRKSELSEAPPELLDVVGVVRQFVGPVAEALAAGRSFSGIWEPPGPWRSS